MPFNGIEVAPPATLTSKWNEISIDIGASKSTLQDGPSLDLAGGFAYAAYSQDDKVQRQDASPQGQSHLNPAARRFIYWRAVKDVLELVELSLDTSLSMNQVRIRFVDLPILQGGVNIVEHANGVIILVATVSSIHRFIFPHPRTISSPYSHGAQHSSLVPLSIFSRAHADNLCDPNHYYILDAQQQRIGASSGRGVVGDVVGSGLSGTNPVTLVTCTSWVEGGSRNAVFVLSGSNAVLHVIKLLDPNQNSGVISSPQSSSSSPTIVPESERVVTFDLKRYNFMARIWNSLPSIITRNRENAESIDDAPALVSHPFGDDYLIYSLSRNLKLRAWSFKDQKCLLETNIVEFAVGKGVVNTNLNTTLDVNSSFSSSLGGSNNQTPIASGRPILRCARNETSGDGSITVAAYVEYDKEPQFILFRPLVIENVIGQVKLECLARMGSPPFDDLIDFSLTNCDNELWAVGSDASLDSTSPYAIYHQSYEKSPQSTRSSSGEDGHEEDMMEEEDPQENLDDEDLLERGWTISFVEKFITSDNMRNIIGSHGNANAFSDGTDKYISDIFCQGKFSLQIISRAIRAYGKQFLTSGNINLPDMSVMDLGSTDQTVLVEKLYNEAQRAVALTIDRKNSNKPRSQEEANLIFTNEWSKIARACYQCRDVENRVKGLFLINYPLDGNRNQDMFGHVSLIKQSNVSFSRPIGGSFEHLILSRDLNDIGHHLESLRLASSKPRLSKKLIISLTAVFRGVQLISSRLDNKSTEEFEAAFYGRNSAQLSPSDCAQYLAQQVLAVDVDTENVPLKFHLTDLFDNATEITAALDFCLNQLDLQIPIEQQDLLLKSTANSSGRSNGKMSSSLGLLVLSESARQQARVRFNFARDLLLLEYLITSLRNSRIITGKSSSTGEISTKFEVITSHHLQRTIDICTAYHYLTWICETYPMASGSVFENNSEFNQHYMSSAHLAFAELVAHLAWSHDRVKWIQSDQLAPLVQSHLFVPKSLLYQFIRERGLSLSLALLSLSDQRAAYLTDLPVALLQILWPVSQFNYLLEYLFVAGQFSSLSTGIQLIESQSTLLGMHSQPMRQFMRGVCLLMQSEPDEAVKSFLNVIKNIQNDRLLAKLFEIPFVPLNSNRTEKTITRDVAYSYFNKMIQIFKCYKLNHQIIRLTTSALSYIQRDVAEIGSTSEDVSSQDYLSSLYTTLFMCRLELDEPSNAHLAMTLVPDAAQRRVCLRQFIVYHHDRNHWSSLIGDFSLAGDLLSDFISIMELRARSSDISQCISTRNALLPLEDTKTSIDSAPSYYEILYALHVKNINYHRAASMAFELATRLQQEVRLTNKAVLEKQLDALQMTINALDLIEDPDLRYILTKSPRGYTGDEVMETNECDSLAVVSMSDVKRQYEILSCRLILLEKQLASGEGAYLRSNSIALSPLSATELLTLLVGNNLFDSAFRIVSKCFGSLSSEASYQSEAIFDGLCTKYLSAVAGHVSVEEMQEMILDNHSLRTGSLAQCASSSPAARIWLVLTHYLNKFEPGPRETHLHKCVTKRLLSAGHVPLPASLVALYKRRNWDELLRLYMTHNFLTEATELASEFFQALASGVDVGSRLPMSKIDESNEIVLARPLAPFSPPTYVPLHLVSELRSLVKNEMSLTEDLTRERELDQLLNSLDTEHARYAKVADIVSKATLRTY